MRELNTTQLGHSIAFDEEDCCDYHNDVEDDESRDLLLEEGDATEGEEDGGREDGTEDPAARVRASDNTDRADTTS